MTVPAPGLVGSPPIVVRGLLGRRGGILQVTQFRSRNRFQSDGFKLSRLVEAVMMITGECRSGTVWGNVSATPDSTYAVRAGHGALNELLGVEVGGGRGI